MKLRVVWLLVVFSSVGCASKSRALPEVEAVAVSPEKKQAAKPVEPKAVARKDSAGKVTFQGLDAGELASIRVIPETGKEVFEPENRAYDQVDGFWWRGDAGHWFKIPDLAEAWVGEAPGQFDGTAHRGDLKIYQRSHSVIKVLGRLAGRVTVPAWVPDAGATGSPVKRAEAFSGE